MHYVWKIWLQNDQKVSKFFFKKNTQTTNKESWVP
jgi:hypothetical protein